MALTYSNFNFLQLKHLECCGSTLICPPSGMDLFINTDKSPALVQAKATGSPLSAFKVKRVAVEPLSVTMLETRKVPLPCTKHHFCITNSFVLHPRKTNLFVLHKASFLHNKLFCLASTQNKSICLAQSVIFA